MNRTSILGLGTALPQHRIGRDAAARYARSLSCTDPGQYRKLEAIYRRSGIESRGSVLLEELPDRSVGQRFYPAASSGSDRGPSTRERGDRYAREAPAMAQAAAAGALRDASVSAVEITHLVTVSCTGFSAPGFDISLIDGLGLSPYTERVQVGFMGCHGAINGLRAARGLVAENHAAKVLMCSVELCSLHYQYGYDANRIVSGALFADGSGAAVVGHAVDGSGSGPGAVVATGSCLVPESRDAMTWRIGDHGFEMTLSARVPALIEEHLKPYLEAWLGERGYRCDSIGGWAVHPGGLRILTAVQSALSLAEEDLQVSREVLAVHGNMSSATMLVVLETFARRGQPKPWLMLGFGPGLEIEVALIT